MANEFVPFQILLFQFAAKTFFCVFFSILLSFFVIFFFPAGKKTFVYRFVSPLLGSVLSAMIRRDPFQSDPVRSAFYYSSGTRGGAVGCALGPACIVDDFICVILGAAGCIILHYLISPAEYHRDPWHPAHPRNPEHLPGPGYLRDPVCGPLVHPELPCQPGARFHPGRRTRRDHPTGGVGPEVRTGA